MSKILVKRATAPFFCMVIEDHTWGASLGAVGAVSTVPDFWATYDFSFRELKKQNLCFNIPRAGRPSLFKGPAIFLEVQRIFV